MAGINLHITTGEVSLVAATAKTVLQIIAAANHRVKLKQLEIYFKGTVSTDTPVLIRILRQTTAGTVTSVTPVTNDASADETVQTTASKNASAEPTASTVLKNLEIHPQTGVIMPLPFGDEILIAGGTRLGIECTAAQGQTVVINGVCEE